MKSTAPIKARACRCKRMINSHFCAAPDEAGRVSPVAPAVEGRGAGLAQAISYPPPTLRAPGASETESSSEKKESADKNRPAPVQAREMGGPMAGLIVRPRNASDALS